MQQIATWLQRIIEFSFYGLFFLTPFIFNPGNSELFEMPKMYFIYALTIVIVGAWLTKSALVGRLVFRRSLLDLPLLLFLLSQLISTYSSIDPHTSIYGYYSRINGGLLSVIAYCLLYWAYVSNMSSKNTIFALRYTLVAAVLISLWGIMEHAGYSLSCYLLKENFNADCWVQNVQERVFASLGQPNWLAAYLVATLPLSLILFKNQKYTLIHRRVYFILPVILLTAVVFTKSRSGLLGLAAAIATFAFFQLPNKIFLKAGYLLLIVISGFFLWQYNLSDCFDLNPNQLVTSGGTESCKIRTIVWKGALDIWGNNPIVGTGPETFAYSYYQYRPLEHNLTSEWELLYNKAHNEYLNYAANTGSIGVLAYLALISSALFYMFKNFKFEILNLNSNYKLKIAILSGYVSILVTNFFGFSISVVNLLFFLYPAMALSLTAIGHNAQDTAHRGKLTIISVILLGCTLIATCYSLFTVARYWQADLQYAKADKKSKQGLYQEAASLVKDALFIRSDEPVFYNELAENASYLAVNSFENKDATLSAQLAELSIDSSNLSLSISPYNLNFLKNNSIIYARLSLIDPTYIKMAIPSLERAIQIAPTDPKVHYNLAVIYARAGEKDKAKAMLNKALELKPDYQDAQESLQELQK